MLPPCTPVNEILVALIPIVGWGAAVMVNLTATVCGELVAPVLVMAIVPVCVPMAKPLTFAATVNEPLLVPDASEPPFSVSQLTEDVAVQLRVPDPLLDIVTDWLAGLVVP
jgi:hypothetical protein